MQVALVHDWLTGMRGGEWVLAEIARLFPEATIHTLVHRPGKVSAELEQHPIRTSWLQHASFGGRRWRWLLPVMPAAIESLSLPQVDLVISTSHCVAKGVIPPPGAYHISYIHTPMRYAWDQREAYVEQLPSFMRPFLGLQLSRMREWDMVSAARVDRLLANSRLVAWRIRHYWNRAADVLPPPVDTEYFTPGGERGDSLLMVAALVPYKKVEVGIRVAQEVGRPLEVIGTGPMKKKLSRLGGEGVRFRDWVSRDELREAYRRAAALLVPNIEDFGMAAVEALSCGTPTIGLAESGTADVVRPGCDGALAPHETVDELAEATRRVLSSTWDVGQLRERAQTFSRERFLLRFHFLLDRLGFGEAFQ